MKNKFLNIGLALALSSLLATPAAAQSTPKRNVEFCMIADEGKASFMVDHLFHGGMNCFKVFVTLGDKRKGVLPYREYDRKFGVEIVFKLPKGGNLSKFAAGEYDSLLQEFFAAAKKDMQQPGGRTVTAVFFNEVNIHEERHGAGQDAAGKRKAGNSPESFKQAWCHLHRQNAGTVRLGMMFNRTSSKVWDQSDFEQYVPPRECWGDEVGFSSYCRTGLPEAPSEIQHFYAVSKGAYETLARLYPGLPIVVNETGAAKGCKRNPWFTDFFADLRRMDRISKVNFGFFVVGIDHPSKPSAPVSWRLDGAKGETKHFRDELIRFRDEFGLVTPPLGLENINVVTTPNRIGEWTTTITQPEKERQLAMKIFRAPERMPWTFQGAIEDIRGDRDIPGFGPSGPIARFNFSQAWFWDLDESGKLYAGPKIIIRGRQSLDRLARGQGDLRGRHWDNVIAPALQLNFLCGDLKVKGLIDYGRLCFQGTGEHNFYTIPVEPDVKAGATRFKFGIFFQMGGDWAKQARENK